jgi:hypothetical protein
LVTQTGILRGSEAFICKVLTQQRPSGFGYHSSFQGSSKESKNGVSDKLPFYGGCKQFYLYSGCQKNVPVFKRFFLQPLMPQFRISEHYYGKRYKKSAVLDEGALSIY